MIGFKCEIGLFKKFKKSNVKAPHSGAEKEEEMKKGLILLAMVMFVFGCGKSEVPVTMAPEPKLEKAVVVSHIDEKGRLLDKGAADKQAAIEEVKAAFNVPLGIVSQKPDWFKEVKGEKSSSFALSKVHYDIFLKMEWALGNFNPKNIHSFGTLDWAEVGFSEKDAKKIYREAGLILAANLMATLNFPREEREEAGQCGMGEASLPFVDTLKVLDCVVHIFQEIGAEPKDIKMTAADFRKYALRGNKEEVERWRKELKTRPDSADLQGLLYGAIREAIDGWHFSSRELGLSKEEIAIIKK